MLYGMMIIGGGIWGHAVRCFRIDAANAAHDAIQQEAIAYRQRIIANLQPDRDIYAVANEALRDTGRVAAAAGDPDTMLLRLGHPMGHSYNEPEMSDAFPRAWDPKEAAELDRQLYRSPAPDGLSRELIARLVAHRLQEQRRCKLDRDVAEHLDRLARGSAPRRLLKPGTMLIREHDGVTHEVVVVPGGFLWNGKTFPSLSTIAKKITGTSWNGPRFFGLRQRPPAEGSRADA